MTSSFTFSLRTLRSRVRLFACFLSVGVAMAVVAPALADVRREGEWPATEKRVTLNFEKTPRRLAVKRLADAAGWGVVVPSDVEDPVDVFVKDQPAGKVLDLLLEGGTFVAKRDGEMVLIVRNAPSPVATKDGVEPSLTVPDAFGATPPVPPVPVTPGALPAPLDVDPAHDHERRHDRGKHRKSGGDRIVTGASFRLEKGESIDDLTVFGGAADIYGTVNGDIAVIGGATRIHEGGHVHGDAMAVGGSLTVEDGARVDGDVGAVGGNVNRGDKAIIGGSIKGPGHVSVDDEDEDDDETTEIAASGSSASTAGNIDHDGAPSTLARLARSLMQAMTVAAMLFVFGSVFLALGTKRMDALKLEAAVRPMRSFALGIVGTIAAFILVCALCITLVGIPVALVAMFVSVFAIYAGVCAVLTMIGEVLLRHRTQNEYVHLAVGCGLLAFVGALPWIGGFATIVVLMLAIGVLVATRGAGLVLIAKQMTPAGPYRTSSNPDAL
jgi:hypothetical protein